MAESHSYPFAVGQDLGALTQEQVGCQGGHISALITWITKSGQISKKNAHCGHGYMKQTHQAKGTVGPGAQHLPRGDSGDGISSGHPGLKPLVSLWQSHGDPFLSLTINNLTSSRKPKHQCGKGARQGAEGGGALEARNPGSTGRAPPPPRRASIQTLSCAKQTPRKPNPKPSERILWVISCPSFVQAREAPVNGKATAKHHWPGPGTTSTQGKRHLRGSLPAHHPAQNTLQVPRPRQGSSLITSSQVLCQRSAWRPLFQVKGSKGASRGARRAGAAQVLLRETQSWPGCVTCHEL